MKKTLLFMLLFVLLLVSCRSGGAPNARGQEPDRYFADLGRGVDALQRRDYPTAIHFLKLAVAERPDSAKALNLRGMAYLMDNKGQEARADFEQAIRLDPALDPAYQNLGCCLMNEKKLAEAEAVLRQGAERFPATAAMHFDLGSVLVLQGRIDEAMAALRRGVELDPEYLTRERQFATGPGRKDEGDPELSFSYARLFAAAGNAAKTAEFLQRAKKAGFKDWQRLAALDDFDPVRDDPALKEFLK